MTTTRRPLRSCLLTGVALALAAASSLGAAVPSATAAATQAPSRQSSAADPARLVIKVSKAEGCGVNAWDQRYAVVVDSPVLASRGIYQVHGSDPQHQTDAKAADKLAGKLEKQGCVVYAEPDADLHLADTQFHSWQFHSWDGNSPKASGSGNWKTQGATEQLGLAEAQTRSEGAGITVAVLDTGIDAAHPALTGRLRPGYDYVSDDADPADVATGVDSDADGHADSAVGHGTFTAGLVTLVAPKARVLPYRVLDSDGNGNVFTIAQAILDAADAGADIINLSFGTDSATQSDLITDALKMVYKRGVVVVVAAGNSGTDTPSYPASLSTVISVGALDEAGTGLATFSGRGRWVSVAAPGTAIIGPVPGNRFAEWSGTSMATPLVAGQLALLAGIDGLAAKVKPEEVTKKRRELVTRSARSLEGTKDGTVDLVGSLTLAAENADRRRARHRPGRSGR